MRKILISILALFFLTLKYAHAIEPSFVDLTHPKGVTVHLEFPNGEVHGYKEETVSHSGSTYSVMVLQVPEGPSNQYIEALVDISITGGQGSWLLTRSSSLDFSSRTLVTGSSYLDTKGSKFTTTSSSYYRVQYDNGYLFFTIKGALEQLVLVADPSAVKPDGTSSSTLIVTARNTSGTPRNGDTIVFEPPGLGSIQPLTGTTNAAGVFQADYTAPFGSDLNGEQGIDLIAQNTSLDIQAHTHITFNQSSLGIWAEPNMAASGNYPETLAIIPPDKRFPAKYSLTLYERPGKIAPDKTLVIRLTNPSRATLDTDTDQDGEIKLKTDAQGRAEFTYRYTGNVPQDKALEDTIIVSCLELSLEENVTVSVGLKIELVSVSEVWEADAQMPETLGLLLELRDGFRPEMDLTAYWKSLQDATGKDFGVRITTEWLNPPAQGFFDTLSEDLKSIFKKPLNNTLYDGPGHIIKAGEKTVADACTTPYKKSGEHFLPAVILKGPGLHLIRVKVRPAIIDECGSGSYQNLPTPANDPGILMAATVYESEHWFMSLTCAFQPTSKQQFMAQTLFLDNPFFTAAEYVGKTVSAPIGIALGIQKAANLICDLLSGNYLGAAGTILAKYNTDMTDQIQKLIDKGEPLTRNQATAFLMSKTAQFTANALSAAQSAKTHFKGRSSLSALNPDDWPDDLTVEEFYQSVTHIMAGLLGSPAMEGREILCISNGSEINLFSPQGVPLTHEIFRVQVQGITAFVIPKASGYLSLTKTLDSVEIFRYAKGESNQVNAALYTFAPLGSPSKIKLDLTSDIHEPCRIDQDNNGSFDSILVPEVRDVTLDPSGDGVLDLTDAALVLRLLTHGTLMNGGYEGADVNRDGKLGQEEAVFILQKISNLRIEPPLTIKTNGFSLGDVTPQEFTGNGPAVAETAMQGHLLDQSWYMGSYVR